MGKSAIESVRALQNSLDSSGACGGHLVPKNPEISETFPDSFAMADGLMVPKRPARPRKAFLDGNLVRRKLPLRSKEYCIWDTQLPGFGLRVRPSGAHVWFVRLRQRGKHRRVSLGKTQDVEAVAARASARRLLADVALDGLPKRVVVKSTPTLTDYVEIYWKDIARYWKPSTQKRNLDAWKRDLGPVFGSIRVADISRTDVTRWRDDCAGDLEARFNRALPVLASLLKYAEQLHLRPKASNPCRAMQRYRRARCERFLTPLEYRRVGSALRDAEGDHPAEVAIIRLLLYTGARISEIKDLKWEWVRPPYLLLPDSKTGAKTIWLNSQALRTLDAVPRLGDCPFVFPNAKRTGPMVLGNWWPNFRRTCAIPDVRIHDLRHSFASTAVMDNVPLATLGKLLGHLLTETTAKYAHLSDDTIADAAQRVCELLARNLGLKQ
jgi:integrase